MITMTLLDADRVCSPERATRTAATHRVWTTVPAGVIAVSYQGTTVSGVSLQGTGLSDPAFIAGDTARVRNGVPAGTTTSSSPPV